MIKVEVAYALPERQEIVELNVADGCTAFEAAQLSNISALFSGLDLETAEMGIFSKRLDGKVLPLPKDRQLNAGDRVEIYRALLIDPKEARALRAKKARKKKVSQ